MMGQSNKSKKQFLQQRYDRIIQQIKKTVFTTTIWQDNSTNQITVFPTTIWRDNSTNKKQFYHNDMKGQFNKSKAMFYNKKFVSFQILKSNCQFWNFFLDTCCNLWLRVWILPQTMSMLPKVGVGFKVGPWRCIIEISNWNFK